MDPESGLDGIRWVAIDSGRISAISERRLRGREVLDVTGLVVAPGFINLDALGQDTTSVVIQARDGVTTALELRDGVYPVDDWYQAREGIAVINFGASVSHLRARSAAVPAAGPPRSTDGTEMEELVRRMRQGLAEGGIGFAFDLRRNSDATPAEIEDLFAVAGYDRRIVVVLVPDLGQGALDQVLVAAQREGTALHIVPTENAPDVDLEQAIEQIDRARSDGVDVTIEVHPQSRSGGSEGLLALALSQEGVIVASDPPGFVGEGARPAGAGTFARLLGRYAGDARARMTSVPALRLEGSAPAFLAKGRVRVGAVEVELPERVPDRPAPGVKFSSDACPPPGPVHAPTEARRTIVHGHRMRRGLTEAKSGRMSRGLSGRQSVGGVLGEAET